MSSIKSVQSISREVDRLNLQFDKMVAAGKAFKDFLFSPYLFEAYSEYHSLLTEWSDSLITIHPALPNDLLPQQRELPNMQPEGESLFGGQSETSLITKIVLFLFGVPIYILAGVKILPWLVPVLFTVGVVVYLCGGAQLLERYLNKTKEEEEPDMDTSNPGDWISKDLQKMSDTYDDVRILISGQDSSPEKLSPIYRKQDTASFRRSEQEKEVFPNECLTIYRKVMVFCTNAYYERKDQLISHYPVGNPSPQPQMPTQGPQ